MTPPTTTLPGPLRRNFLRPISQDHYGETSYDQPGGWRGTRGDADDHRRAQKLAKDSRDLNENRDIYASPGSQQRQPNFRTGEREYDGDYDWQREEGRSNTPGNTADLRREGQRHRQVQDSRNRVSEALRSGVDESAMGERPSKPFPTGISSSDESDPLFPAGNPRRQDGRGGGGGAFDVIRRTPAKETQVMKEGSYDWQKELGKVKKKGGMDGL